MKRWLCVLLVMCGVLSVSAEEIDFGTYIVDVNASEGWHPSIHLPDGQAIIKAIFSQILLPDGPEGKKHIYENFTYEQPLIEKENGILVIKGKGMFQKALNIEGINVGAVIEMNYNLTFSPEGKLYIVYEFINNGDDIFAEPFFFARLNYDFVKNQQWEIKKVEGKEQQGVWPETIVHGVNSLDYSTGRPVELQVLSASFNTSVGKPLTYKPSEQSHLRISGEGTVSLYNFAHFAGEWTEYNWKTFKAKERFSIEVEILLPVEPGNLKTE